MKTLLLYHTGFQKIEAPQLRIGRKNADFGQGFYLSEDGEFSLRWARRRSGAETWLNCYELDPNGLRIKELDRDAAWLDYIFQNRAGRPDSLAEYDIIVGPIAADILYNMLGIFTSVLIPPETALRLLRLGPLYRQTVLKTEAAISRLRFLSARVLGEEEIGAYRDAVRAEEADYQALAAAELDRASAE